MPSLLAALSVGLTAGDVSRSRADADQMLRKIAVIATQGMAARPEPRRTPLTESEVNSFLEFHLRSELPPSVLEPTVGIEESGRLRGRALVDLDELKQAQAADDPTGMLAMLTGRVPVEATGTLRAGDGVGQFTLEQALVGGVPVPKSVLRQVVAYYSRSPEHPEGIDFEAPFALPVNIRAIETLRGQVVVVQ
jgi:hypothetical protein